MPGMSRYGIACASRVTRNEASTGPGVPMARVVGKNHAKSTHSGGMASVPISLTNALHLGESLRMLKIEENDGALRQSDPDQQPIQRVIGRRVSPPSGRFPS